MAGAERPLPPFPAPADRPSQRLKVLVSAYACAPDEGSEPAVGWNTVKSLARHHDLWVLTRPMNEPAIAAELARSPVPGLTFVYHDPRLGRRFDPVGSRWWVQAHYYLWQTSLLEPGRRLHQAIGFDVVHHVTYARYWMPNPLAALGPPFLWGPVGGGEDAPLAFLRGLPPRQRALEGARALARALGEIDPQLRRTARHAALALAATEETARRLKTLGCTEVRVMSQVGLSGAELDGLARDAPPLDRPWRMVSLGRLLHWKGFHLGIEAFARARTRSSGLHAAEYWIIGDGPEMGRLRALAHGLGVTGAVRFTGPLDREQTWAFLRRSDVLVHPSLHDSGGLACTEAMAAGLPVICLDLGGPAQQVGEAGLRVPARSPAQAVEDLARAILKIHGDPKAAKALGLKGQDKARRDYDWNRKGGELAGLYREIALGRTLADRP